MLNENIRARINAFVAAEIAPRRRAFKEALQAEQNRLNARGLLKSGVGVRAAVRLGADELRVRATIVRGAVLRSYSSMSGQLAGESTLEDLREEIRGHVGTQAGNVQSIVAATVAISIRGLGTEAKLAQSVADELATCELEAVNRLDIDVQEFVDNLKRSAEMSERGAPGGSIAHLNFFGSVGAVQTGHYAIANVSFSDPADRARFIHALEELRRAIEQDTEMPANARGEISEIAGDLIEAANAEKLNGRKLSMLLGGLAQGIQTVASLRGAWDVVSDAAAMAGVTLPRLP
jgi:hypothetical protein